MSKYVTYRFTGKTVLITGAGSGIGRTCAQAFGKAGARVVVSDIDSKSGQETALSLSSEGVDCLFVQADVTSDEQVKLLVEKSVNHFGCLDFTVNNAGIMGSPGKLVDIDENNWDAVIATNLKGMWLCMKHSLKQMVKQQHGVIVNQSSALGIVGCQNAAAYVASKHAICGLTKVAALEYAAMGIRINATGGGPVETNMLEEFVGHDQEAKNQLAQIEPVQRLGRTQDIANAVLWLCSDATDFIHGQTIIVDGGWTAQ